MAPPLPPKPTIGPLVRRTLLATALGTAGCAGPKHAPRIGPPPDPRIGPAIVEPEPVEPRDAGPDAPEVPATTDAAPGPVELKKAPPRIGPPPPRIGPPVRIGAEEPLNPSRIRGEIRRDDGTPLAHASLRIELGSGTRIVATDGAGRFELDGLLPGEHPVVISARGFAPAKVVLATARPARLSLSV